MPCSAIRPVFWSAIFFAGQTLNNILAFVDVTLGPTVDWSLAPNLVALASIIVLLYALIWETT